MIKLVLLLSFIPFLLLARENPFFPAKDNEDIPLTSNIIHKAPPLKRATITLPSTARVLTKVVVSYKNLDGSIATKEIDLQNSIDWHLPIFISQNYDSSVEKVVHLKKKRKLAFKKIASLSFVSFYEDGKLLKIATKDKLLRSFLLVKPHRIVCDFKRETTIGSYEKRVAKPSLFKKIRVGTHKGYYRVVIELDGYYQFKVTKRDGSYLFKLL